MRQVKRRRDKKELAGRVVIDTTAKPKTNEVPVKARTIQCANGGRDSNVASRSPRRLCKLCTMDRTSRLVARHAGLVVRRLLDRP